MGSQNTVTVFILFWFGDTGVEKLWKEGGWKKIQTGSHLEFFIKPFLAEDDPTFPESIFPFSDEKDQSLAILTLFKFYFDNLLDPRRKREISEKKYSYLLPGRKEFAINSHFTQDGSPLDILASVMTNSLKDQHPLYWLLSAWTKSMVAPYPLNGKFGWLVATNNLYNAAVCELILLIIHNLMPFKVCSKCFSVHRENKWVCKKCTSKINATYKKKKPRTEKDKFLERVRQDIHRGKVIMTKNQREELRRILKVEGLIKAKAHYDKLLSQ